MFFFQALLLADGDSILMLCCLFYFSSRFHSTALVLVRTGKVGASDISSHHRVFFSLFLLFPPVAFFITFPF